MLRSICVFLLTLSFINVNSQSIKYNKVKKKNKGNTVINQSGSFHPIPPAEYQNLLGKGTDVDWVKTGKGMANYNSQAVRDFKAAGLSHIRIRMKDRADEKLLKHLSRVVRDCIAADLIPIIAYQGAKFKSRPSEENLNEIVAWWKNVSEYFRDYPAQVSYDILIEVTEALNKEPETLNRLYEKVVTEIRKTNPQRIIFISPIVRSSPENLKDLKIPTMHNNYLMAEWHFYASGPDRTNENKKWTTGTEAEKNLIINKIRIAKEWSSNTGILTWIGAWMPGNYNKSDEYNVEEQIAFARFVTCELTKNKIPFAFNSDVHFYNRETNRWITHMKPIVDEIVKTNCTN